MNSKQQKLLIGMIAVIMLMALFPPFRFIGENGVILNAGYGFVFFPPTLGSFVAQVHVGMLLTQWVGVLIVGGLAFLLFREK